MIRNSRRMVALAVAGAVAIAPVISGCGAGAEPQSAAPTQLTDGVNVSVPKDEPGAAQIDLRNMFLLGPRPGEPVSPGTSLALYGVMINQVKGRQDRLVSVGSPLFGSARIDGGGLVLPPAAQDGTGSMVKLLGKASAPSPTPTGRRTRQPGATTPPGTASPAPTGAPATPEPTGPGATPEPTGPGATPEPTASPTSGNTAGPQGSGLPVAPGGEQPLVVLTGLRQELLAGTRVPIRMQFEKAGAVEFTVPLVPQQEEYNTYPLATPIGGRPTQGTQTTPGTPGSPGTHESPGAPTPTGNPQPSATTEPPAGTGAPGAAGH